MNLLKHLCSIAFLVFYSIMSFSQVDNIKGVKLTSDQQKAIELATNQNLINAHDFNGDEEVFVSKPRDEKRINAIPKITLNKSAMNQYLSDLHKSVLLNTENEIIEKCKRFINGKSPNEISTTAVLLWYQGNEEEALLLSLELLLVSHDSSTYWNNLGALLNLAGMEELAVPVLNYGLFLNPGQAALLNNLGQAWLGMGEISKAEDYLKQCLSKQPNHPEANRSMGVVEASKGNSEKAAGHFEKDVEVNMRESSYKMLKKLKPGNFSLNELRKRFLASKKQNNKDFYSLLSLENLDLPQLPYNTNATEKWVQESEVYIQSVAEEMSYWQSMSFSSSQEDQNFNIYQNTPYYSWLVESIIYELNQIYEYELLPSSDIFLSEMHHRALSYHEKLNSVNCPVAPAGSDIKTLEAFDVKCNSLKKAVHDEYMATHNEKVKKNYDFRNGQWKEFLNDILGTIELCPTPDNIALAYTYLNQYTSFLAGTVQLVVAIDNPAEGLLTEAEADLVIRQSKRELNLKCPDFLQYDYSIPGIGSINFGCTSYKIEVTPFKMTKLGYKRSFKDQTSTISLGVGPSWTVGHVGISTGVEAFLVFDKHDQFVNSGISAEAKAVLPQSIAEISATAKLDLNSGYSHEVKTDSRFVSGIKTTLAKY